MKTPPGYHIIPAGAKREPEEKALYSRVSQSYGSAHGENPWQSLGVSRQIPKQKNPTGYQAGGGEEN